MSDTFVVKARATSGVSQNWSSETEAGTAFTVAIPPQFQGPGTGVSPEDFYGLALLNCWLATFKVVAEKSRFEFASLEGEATLTTGKNEAGRLWIPTIHIKLVLSGVADEDKGRRLVEMASQHCLILNSVNTVKTWDLEVRA